MQVVTTGKMHFGINKGNFVTFQGPKTTSSAYHMPFESSQKGPNRPEMGQWFLPSKYWLVGPLCSVWNQIWCHKRLPEGQKVPYRGKSDPLWTPQTPLEPPRPSQKPSWSVLNTNTIPIVTTELTSTLKMSIWPLNECWHHFLHIVGVHVHN